MLTRKEKMQKLLELERLIKNGGDKQDIRKLRIATGTKTTKRPIKAANVKLKQIYRMTALGIPEAEIIFILAIGFYTFQDLKNSVTIEEFEAGVAEYKTHRKVLNSRITLRTITHRY